MSKGAQLAGQALKYVLFRKGLLEVGIRPVEGGAPDAQENYVMNIRYLDDYVRLPEGWRIAKRELQVEFTEVFPIL